MSRCRGEFEHRTSIFEGAFRAWSHLGGLSPAELESKSVSDLDPLDHPLLANDPRTEGVQPYPYEPLPRSGLSHPYVQSIITPWLGPDRTKEDLEKGLTIMRTWWQHRRKGESTTSMSALGTPQMQSVVKGYTRHYFNVAYCLVVHDKEQAPRTLHKKLKALKKSESAEERKKRKEEKKKAVQKKQEAKIVAVQKKVLSMPVLPAQQGLPNKTNLDQFFCDRNAAILAKNENNNDIASLRRMILGQNELLLRMNHCLNEQQEQNEKQKQLYSDQAIEICLLKEKVSSLETQARQLLGTSATGTSGQVANKQPNMMYKSPPSTSATASTTMLGGKRPTIAEAIQIRAKRARLDKANVQETSALSDLTQFVRSWNAEVCERHDNDESQ